MRSLIGLISAALLVAAVATTASAAASQVEIVDNAFATTTLTVHVGDTVTWQNTGKRAHTATSDSGEWNSGTLAPGGTFAFTFTSPGTFAYHCNFHEEMHAAVSVQPAPAVAVAPTSTAIPLAPTPTAVAQPAVPIVTPPTPTAQATPPVQAGGLTNLQVEIDPVNGGMLSTAAGDVVVSFAPGAVMAPTGASIVDAFTSSTAATPDGYVVFRPLAQVTVDGSLNLPAALTVRPNDADIAAAGGDPSNFLVAELSADAAIWQPLNTAVNDDGSLGALLDRPGVVGLLLLGPN